MYKQLEPLRERNYLSYWDGHTFVKRAITAQGTGNTPFDLVIENENYRDIYFDAPLGEMWEPAPKSLHSFGDAAEVHPSTPRLRKWKAGKGRGMTGTEHVTSADVFDTTNSYYASTFFAKSVGFPWTGRLSRKQLEIVRGQIRGAKRRGLKARYWATPAWPTSLRNYIWKTLLEEGADMLNVDDLKAAASLDWDIVRHGWFDA